MKDPVALWRQFAQNRQYKTPFFASLQFLRHIWREEFFGKDLFFEGNYCYKREKNKKKKKLRQKTSDLISDIANSEEQVTRFLSFSSYREFYLLIFLFF